MQDVFSAGCVLAEIFMDGKLLFDRPQVPPNDVTCIAHLQLSDLAVQANYNLHNQYIRVVGNNPESPAKPIQVFHLYRINSSTQETMFTLFLCSSTSITSTSICAKGNETLD